MSPEVEAAFRTLVGAVGGVDPLPAAEDLRAARELVRSRSFT